MSDTNLPVNGRQVLVNIRYGTVHALDCKFANRPNAAPGQYDTCYERDVPAGAHRCRKCGG